MENDLKGEDSFCSNCDVEVIKESNMKTHRLKFKFKFEGWTGIFFCFQCHPCEIRAEVAKYLKNIRKEINHENEQMKR